MTDVNVSSHAFLDLRADSTVVRQMHAMPSAAYERRVAVNAALTVNAGSPSAPTESVSGTVEKYPAPKRSKTLGMLCRARAGSISA